MVFNFQLGREVKFQGFSGYASRGIFYEMLEMADEKLAWKVHNSKTLAPFSTTPVMSRGKVCFNRVRSGYASVSFTF